MVIYDSLFGNTKEIAETMAKELKVKAVHIGGVSKSEIGNHNLLIVGGPTHALGWSKDMRDFFKSLGDIDLSGVNAAAFDTKYDKFWAGSASRKIDKALRKLGAKVIIERKSFIVTRKEGPLVEGEIENARKWAAEIREAVK